MGQTIEAGVAVGELVDGAGGIFLLIAVVVAVVLHAAGEANPRGDVILQRSGEDVALLVVDKLVALGGPIGVLHTHAHVAPRPVLHGEVAVGIVALKVFHGVEVGPWGEEIEGVERVEILALRNHVLLLDRGEHIAEVKGELVVEELAGVAHAQVVAVVVVVVDESLRVVGAQREISLIVLRAGREGHGVGEVGRGLEEVGGIVVGRLSELAAPAVEAAGRGLTVSVLELRHHEGMRELEAAGIGDVEAALSTLLRGDEDDTVAGLTTIEGCSRRTGEH